MTELPDKATKLLSLALNQAAPEGEWHSAAIKALGELRKANVPVEFFAARRPTQERSHGYEYDCHIMPFGKFKGVLIADLPDWYLNWIIENLDLREPLKSRVETELENR